MHAAGRSAEQASFGATPVLAPEIRAKGLAAGVDPGTTSTDQVGAALTQWLGLQNTQFRDVFPNLVNFQQKTISLLRA